MPTTTIPSIDGRGPPTAERRPAGSSAIDGHRGAERWPWVIVCAAVAWNLVSLRSETLGVAYLDDSSVHEQMVRLATEQLRGGHLPLTSWFPYLGLGSPQFLHYQSLPSMVTGLIGLAIGPDTAFRWTLYLLLSLWPVSVYLGARLFGAGRPAAAAAAAMSPFLVSATGIGYEQNAYIWTGFGVWTQLWASWTLPLAWGAGWRAIRTGAHLFAAIALVALTIALHFETGYLALAPLVLWPLVGGGRPAQAARRACALIACSLLAAAWVIVPLFEQRQWAATNEILQPTGLVNGYGAGRVLGWLASGQLLDHRRLPVVTALFAVGLVVACTRWRADPGGRALVVALCVCLLLSFGRATFGPLVEVIPGGADIFFRRFMMGVQLAALLLAGRGAAWSAARVWSGVERVTARPSRPSPLAAARGGGAVRASIALVAAALVLAPAWLQLEAHDRDNAGAIEAQRTADSTRGAQLDRLLAVIAQRGGGRVYAGMPSNWGMDFTVGAVPVFKYLESRDVDEVGYTLRTASLMTDPEYFFDEDNPSDYRLFGIHWLIVPSGYLPPVAARFVLRDGRYSLWTVNEGGYVHVGRIVGSINANRTNVGVASVALLRSRLAGDGEYLRVAFGLTGPRRRLPAASARRAAGTVISETDDLDHGEVAATVTMRQAGVVVLSASFDPGWTATVDGHRRATGMVAPALVSTRVPAGTHRIIFTYRGFSGYPLLFVLTGLTLAAALGADALGSRRRREGRSRGDMVG